MMKKLEYMILQKQPFNIVESSTPKHDISFSLIFSFRKNSVEPRYKYK